MKSNLVLFITVTLLVFAIEVISDIVIFQITFGFAHETLVWQMVSATLVAVLVSTIAAQMKRPLATSE